MDRKKRKVLVVESSPANQAQLCECLADLGGIEPVATNSGHQAVALYQDCAPSLILLDIVLPDIDGLTVARRIRALEKSREEAEPLAWTPLVFLSAVTDEAALAEGIQAGGDDYLYKPISEVVLQAKVRAMLRIAEMKQELREAHRRLRELSYLDALTQVPNRRYFDEALQREWQRCARTGAPVGAVFCDVDFFKPFNDRYGHPEGDACLKAVAGSLAESLFRVEDCVARYGGEEFAAILPGTDPEGARAVAERMRASVRDLGIPHSAGVAGTVSCSFGVASLIPAPGSRPQMLLQAADGALYQAKGGGRNRVAVSDCRPDSLLAPG